MTNGQQMQIYSVKMTKNKIKLIKKNNNLPNLRCKIYTCQNKMLKPMNEFQKGEENAKEKEVTNSTDSQPIHIYNFKVNNVFIQVSKNILVLKV